MNHLPYDAAYDTYGRVVSTPINGVVPSDLRKSHRTGVGTETRGRAQQAKKPRGEAELAASELER